MKTKILFLLCIGMLFCACAADEVIGFNIVSTCGPPVRSQPYIQWFFSENYLDGAEVGLNYLTIDNEKKIVHRNIGQEGKKGVVYSVADNIYVYTSFIGKKIYRDYVATADDLGPTPADIEATAKYREWAAKAGDTLFNRDVYYHDVAAITDTIATVDIISDKAFGVNYPAGSSLNNFFTVYFNDPYALIQNNYQPIPETYQYTDACAVNYPFAVCREKLSSIYFSERLFLEHEWCFYLDTAPEQTDEHIFTVRVTFADGRVSEKTVSAITLAGATE
jgi:hypothetical protein